jgi:phytoene dehydrogenase-like protein
MKVAVLERRDMVGEVCVTEELFPDFIYVACSNPSQHVSIDLSSQLT